MPRCRDDEGKASIPAPFGASGFSGRFYGSGDASDTIVSDTVVSEMSATALTTRSCCCGAETHNSGAAYQTRTRLSSSPQRPARMFDLIQSSSLTEMQLGFVLFSTARRHSLMSIQRTASISEA